MASTAFSICFGVNRRSLVTTCRPISSAVDEVPSRPSNSVVFSWLFALDLSLGWCGAQPRPLVEREVHQVVQVDQVLRDEIDPHRLVSEYGLEKLMYWLAGLFAEMNWLRREERSGGAPSEWSQSPNTDWSTSIGKSSGELHPTPSTASAKLTVGIVSPRMRTSAPTRSVLGYSARPSTVGLGDTGSEEKRLSASWTSESWSTPLYRRVPSLMYASRSARLIDWMFLRGPRVVRPSGWPNRRL